MATTNTTFLEDYNQLISMYKGSSELIKLLDSFYTFLDKLTDPNEIVPGYEGPANKLEYRDCYGTRKAVYIQTNKYLDDFFSNDVDNQVKYEAAWGTLKNIQNLFKNFQCCKKIDSFVTNKENYMFQTGAYSHDLALFLRDPLMVAIRVGSEADTPERTTGSTTSNGVIPTTNAEAEDLYTVAKIRKSDPTVLSVTSGTRSSDIHSVAEAKIKDKVQEKVVQNEILNKLADGRYLSDLLSAAESINWLKTGFNAATGAPSALANLINKKTSKDYALNNLIHNSIINVSPVDPQDQVVKNGFREKARKKFGDVRFCDEAKDKDVNGKWVLEENASSIKLLADARKELRNKLLKLK